MYPKYPQSYKKVITIGDKEVTLEVGRFAEQASAAVLVTCGETVVMSTIVLGRPVNLGYFPLSVEFAEKLYSAGTIKGSRWVKRDGRPIDDVILTARVIDRSMRPMFPDGITREVQVINTVFSYDGENDPDMLGLLGSCAAVAISEIPFDGPIAGLRVGYQKETQQFVFNPTKSERAINDLDLIVSGSGQAIVMVEAGANEVEEAVVVEAFTKAQEQLSQICQAITDMVAEIGKPKVDLTVAAEGVDVVAELAKILAQDFKQELDQALHHEALLEKVDDKPLVEAVLATAGKHFGEEVTVTESHVRSALFKAMKQATRDMILTTSTRPDGRKLEEIRPIWCEVDVFPRTHGSALFKRGATQAVTITTLGSPALGQLIESIEGQETRHYMHHYNMPPFASGETGRFGFPSRREIGHGALAERALLPMVPDQSEFPYTIHVVSEIVSSNGSTSQASVCGSTLSLMAAGVPIKRPVAGIAMGLISDGETFRVLSDIQGLEDHVGDMDFKVAGTEYGITALQMDIKLKGIPKPVLEQALDQAKAGRMHILDQMLKCINAPRTELSKYAPRIVQITIPKDKIGEIIGPGGKMIKSIIEESGAEIDVEEDEEKGVGVVNIVSPDPVSLTKAADMINAIIRVIQIDEEFDGKVTRVEEYGAFVEFLPGKEGLVHVSNMSTEFISDPGALYHVGDPLHVRVSEIKDDGKIGLSLLTKDQESARGQHGAGPRRDGGRPPFRGSHGGSGGRSRFGGGRPFRR